MKPTKFDIRTICEKYEKPYSRGVYKKVVERYNKLSHRLKGKLSTLDLMKK